MSTMKNRTVFITGGSRGIGRAIALACARQGANVVIGAKSDEPHPKLPGTIHSVAEEIRQAGGQALPLVLDVRDEKLVRQRIDEAATHFGGIDALVNNAGAIKLAGVENLKVSRYDLMHQVNARAVFLCSQAALPWLKESDQAHILSLSPPLNLDTRWFAQYGPYTTTKFEVGGPQMMAQGRKPDIMADAALSILSRPAGAMTGQSLIDEDVLRADGLTDFEHYRYQAGDKPLLPDLFLD